MKKIIVKKITDIFLVNLTAIGVYFNKMANLNLNQNATKARLIIGVLGLLFVSYGMILVANHMGPLPSIFAGMVITIVLCSLGEWFTHGILYHGKIPFIGFIRDIHHHGHHFALFPTTHYVQKDPAKYEFMKFRKPTLPYQMSDNAFDNFLTKWSQVGLHFVIGIPLIIIPCWILTKNNYFTTSVIVTLSTISWLLAYVHGVIHTPRGRWIEKTRAFLWLDRHHYIHHIDITSNMNFMLPLCDILFGTEKWELTEKEKKNHPTFEEAKPMAYDVNPARFYELKNKAHIFA